MTLPDDDRPDETRPDETTPGTTTSDDVLPDDEVTAFWELARGHAGIGRLASVIGPGAAASVPPPAWAFGDSEGLADELLALVLSGRKTATSVSVAELDAAGEPVPRVGDLSIVLDGRGHPRALLRTTAVEVVRFDEVDAEHARLEGEDDRTLESWRIEHERYWRRVLPGIGAEFGPELPVVAERFERRFPYADAARPESDV